MKLSEVSPLHGSTLDAEVDLGVLDVVVNVGIFLFLPSNDTSTADSQAPVIRIVVAGWDGSKSDSEARKVTEHHNAFVACGIVNVAT